MHESVFIFLLLLLFCFLVVISDSPNSDGITKTTIAPTSNNAPGCKDARLSKVFTDVTLKGGISSGEFTDKGRVSSMDECITKCCGTESCNVAFVIKDTCFVVKCKSYSECALKPAVSEYYSPKIVYVNWNPPRDLGDAGLFINILIDIFNSLKLFECCCFFIDVQLTLLFEVV